MSDESNSVLTVDDVLDLVLDKINWCRCNGESDMRGIMWFVIGIREKISQGKSRDEILAAYSFEEEEEMD